jgi:hypothetical protein
VTAPARLPILLRALLWMLLGGWTGALLLFGAVVTRVAFAALPEPALAGHVVGGVLAPLQLAGIGAGLALAALGGWLRRGRLAVALPLLLAAVCAVNHFGVSPAVAAIDLADPASGPGAGARFASLHELSVVLFTTTAVGVLLLAALHARAELRAEPPRPA